MTEALVLTFLCTLYHVFWAIIYFEEKKSVINLYFNSDFFPFPFFSLELSKENIFRRQRIRSNSWEKSFSLPESERLLFGHVAFSSYETRCCTKVSQIESKIDFQLKSERQQSFKLTTREKQRSLGSKRHLAIGRFLF